MGELCKDQKFTTSYDADWQSYEVNEDALLDHLEPLTGQRAPEPESKADTAEASESPDSEERGGLILDWHACEMWPERWVDLVVVLRCDHEKLWKRLEKR